MMDQFPRTEVGGISLPRLIAGTNWLLGYSHTSLAKDKFIKEYQSRERIAAVLTAFLERGVDAVMAPLSPLLNEAIQDAENRVGRAMIRILTPSFNIQPGGPASDEPEVVFDRAKALGATFCLPHQCVTDALVDRMQGKIRDLDRYTAMIRARGMIPGLSTHMPESIVYADKNNADVETYIQIYNSMGFLMQVEVDWIMHVIQQAHKPVMTIKPLAAGKLQPVVGLAFVWNTIRDQDMVTIGATTPDEVCEVVDISRDLLARRTPDYELQKTRSKASLT
ncbi:MAG: hypothetical protein HY866_13315 [Chloroflexi bacterium]|nr:hypothetical protein [Chloroflexota bacterium]